MKGHQELFRFDVVGRSERQISLPSGCISVSERWIVWARDHRTIGAALEIKGSSSRVCEYDTVKGSWRVVSSGPDDESPIFSPDGEWVAFKHRGSSLTDGSARAPEALICRNASSGKCHGFGVSAVPVLWLADSSAVVAEGDGGLLKLDPRKLAI